MLNFLAVLIATNMDSQPYPSQDEAAKAALTQAIGLSTSYEYGGVIFEKGGNYYYTIPVTSNSGFYVNYHVTIPNGARLVGLYHTHPANTPYANKYSVADVKQANLLNVSSYIGVVKSGVMLSYDPTKIRVSTAMKNDSMPVDYNFLSQKL